MGLRGLKAFAMYSAVGVGTRAGGDLDMGRLEAVNGSLEAVNGPLDAVSGPGDSLATSSAREALDFFFSFFLSRLPWVKGGELPLCSELLVPAGGV